MKKSLLHKALILSLSVLSITSLCSCKGIKLIEETEEVTDVVNYKKSELAEKTYYIKDGATFRTFYNPSVTNDIINLFCGFNTIPTLYKGESIVYIDYQTGYSKEIELTRLKSIGYNFGIYGGYINADGHYVFEIDNVEKSSSNSSVFSSNNSSSIEVYDIDGNPITKEMVYEGVLGGDNYLEAMNTYKVHFYKGTKDYTYELVADTFSMVAFENYKLSNAELTSNGYIQFFMQDDMKSGYYYLEGVGIFRYINEEKENVSNPKDIYYYEPLYGTTDLEKESEEVKETDISLNEETKEDTTYQTFSINIPEVKNEFEFIVYYEPTSEPPYIALQSPTRQVWSLNKIEGQNASEIKFEQVQVGEWKILVKDSDIKILDVVAQEIEKDIVTKEVNKEFEFDNLSSSYKVCVSYNGTILNAYVLNEVTNEVEVLEPTTDNTYEYTYDYLTGGKFKVTVICEETTDVNITMEDCSNYEKESIIVE